MERLLKRLPLNELIDLKIDFAFKQLFEVKAISR
ncbi:hypothetical protein J2S21_001502 [Peribacillus cavernae]|nr:hypothetical protein [Peribacillus cavernae]